MSSPIHRALFSPPTSPGATGASPIFDAIRDFLLPSPSGPSDSRTDRHLSPSPKQSSAPNATTTTAADDLVAQYGPGGFISTRAYPSRLSRPTRPRTPEPMSIPTFVIDDSATRVTLSTSTFNGAESPSLKLRAGSTSPSVSSFPPVVGEGSEISSPFVVDTRKPFVSLRALGIHRSTSRAILVALLVLCSLGMMIYRNDLSFGTSLAVEPDGAVVGSTPAVDGLNLSRVVVKDSAGAPKLLNYHKPDKVPAVAHPKTQQRPTYTPLTPLRELLALQAYLLADPHHTLPADLPADEPLDSMLLLDFKPTDEASWLELEDEADPVVVWTIGKSWNENILALLEIYSILPAAKQLPLDGRSDLPSIERTLARLIPGRPAHARELPLVTIGGRPIATYQDLVKLHNTGELHTMLEEAGAVVDGKKAVEDEEATRRSRGRPLKHAKGGLHRR